MPETQVDLNRMYGIVREAERRLLALRKESKQDLPPIVKAGAPCMWREDHGAWLLHFPIHTTLREVWYGQTLRYEVPAENQRPFTVHLYYKPLGPYWKCSLGGVFTDNGVTMPHIDAGGACMDAALVPETLLTLGDYEALENILTRHCQGIQLMSLYTSNTNCWPKGIMSSLPGEIVEWLEWEDSDSRKPTIKHLFKSVADSEWLADAPEPESDFEEDPEPPEYDVNLCDCETCRAIRAEAGQQVDELPPLLLAQTQGAAYPQAANQLWQIQGSPLPTNPDEIWSI